MPLIMIEMTGTGELRSARARLSAMAPLPRSAPDSLDVSVPQNGNVSGMYNQWCIQMLSVATSESAEREMVGQAPANLVRIVADNSVNPEGV